MARQRIALIAGLATSVALLLGTLSAGIAAAGGGCHAHLERDAAETTVQLVGNCMDPMITRVPTSATVTFVNSDPVAHVITGAAVTWGSFNELARGEQVAYRFTKDGIYPYACYLHPGMTGAVVVGNGGPGAAGSAVVQVAAGLPQQTARPTREASAAPATSTPSPASAAPTRSAGGGVLPATPAASGPTAPTSLLTLGLLAVLIGAGLAYGLGIVPRRRQTR